MSQKHNIEINDVLINVNQTADMQSYICLTDMIRAYAGSLERTEIVIQNWMRRRDTIDYLGFWEKLNNPDFNHIEFDVIRNSAGTNRFILTAKEWCSRTGAVGIVSKAGRYGGTYAHRDIAYHFCMWLSPEFYLLVVKEVQRLETETHNPLVLQWNLKRMLSKTNYTIHTDAVKEHIIPVLSIEKKKEYIVYASEADLLNVILFGCTAKEWADANPELAKDKNMRETASINELIVLSNLESYNAELTRKGLNREERFRLLSEMAENQLSLLQKTNADFDFKMLDGNTPIQR